MSSNKKIVITGAGSGLGKKLSLHLLSQGCELHLIDIVPIDNLEYASASGANEKCVNSYVCDISDYESLGAVAEKIKERTEYVSCLINNAGIFPFNKLENYSSSDIQKIINVNLLGSIYATKQFISQLLLSDSGRVINIGSSTMYSGLSDASIYVASKMGLLGFTRSMAREYQGADVTFNLLSCGLMKTEGVISAGASDEFFDHFKGLQCINKTLTPSDMTGVIDFLISDASSSITGQTINVDGGLNFV